MRWNREASELTLDHFQWTPAQTAYEIHVSHWSGPLPQLSVGVHWTYGHSAIGVFSGNAPALRLYRWSPPAEHCLGSPSSAVHGSSPPPESRPLSPTSGCLRRGG